MKEGMRKEKNREGRRGETDLRDPWSEKGNQDDEDKEKKDEENEGGWRGNGREERNWGGIDQDKLMSVVDLCSEHTTERPFITFMGAICQTSSPRSL